MFKLRKRDDAAAFEKTSLRWQKTRQRGILWFTLTRGMLGYGGLCFAIAIVAQIISDHSTRNLSPHRLVVMAGIWCVAGIFWGLWLWRWLDEKFGDSKGDELSISPRQSK